MAEDAPAAVAPAAKGRRTLLLHVLILAGAQLALGLPYLRTVPRFYNDEAWDASVAHSLAFEGRLRHGIFEGWGGIHVQFVQNQTVVPFVCAGLYRVAGFGVLTSRLGSVLMGLLAVVSTYAAVRRLFGGKEGFIAAAALMLHPWFFEVSRRTRPEVYYTALGIAGTWALVASMQRRSWSLALMAGVLAGLAALSHPTGLLLVASIAVGMLIWLRPARAWRRAATVAVGFLLALLPYALYVLVACQHPDVDFLAQMRGPKSLGAPSLTALLGNEASRWGHFFQWPKGAPLAAVMVVGLLGGWFRSTRADKALATVILAFAVAVAVGTANWASRYLVAVLPFWSALMARAVCRLAAGAPWSFRSLVRPRVTAAAVLAGLCVAAGAAGIGLMLVRLRGADLRRVLDRVAVAVPRGSRIYGELILWMERERYAFGPIPLDDEWNKPLEEVKRKRFDYVVRSAWDFSRSWGVSPPPSRMPPWGASTADRACRRFGRKVATFRDPHFGPMEIYQMDWDAPRPDRTTTNSRPTVP